MMQNFFNIQQKKGNPNQLSGKIIAYAKVHNVPSQGPKQGSIPLNQLITNGILAVVGDYTRDSSFKSFLENFRDSSSNKSDFQQDFLEFSDTSDVDSEENADLTEFLNDLSKELKSDLPRDAKSLTEEEMLEKLESMAHIEVIPVPAQIGHFESEEEILSQDADVFYLGEFQNPHNAQLSTTTFPIMYQASYKEQIAAQMNQEIEGILASALSHDTVTEIQSLPQDGSAQDILTSVKTTLQTKNYKDFEGDLAEYLFTQYVPVVLHHFDNPEADFHLFRRFMTDYPFPEDIDRLEEILPLAREASAAVSREIELLCQKFSALREEKFEVLDTIQKELSQIQG